MNTSETEKIYSNTLLALTFSSILKNWLSKAEMKEVIELNKSETDEGVCHSHDFCDANEAMDEAFTQVLGRELDLQNEDDKTIWNTAWNTAMEKEFFFTA